MGAIEELYFLTLKELFAGAQLNNVHCGTDTFFNFTRACIADDCCSDFKKRGPLIVSSDDHNKIFMPENVFKNYCITYGHHIPPNLNVQDLN